MKAATTKTILNLPVRHEPEWLTEIRNSVPSKQSRRPKMTQIRTISRYKDITLAEYNHRKKKMKQYQDERLYWIGRSDAY